MSRARPRTEKLTRYAAAAANRAADRGKLTRRSWLKLVPLMVRSACGLLAAMHIAPLLRVSRHVLEQGPTPALVATWAVLALLVGALAAKAAGLAFLPSRSGRFTLVAIIAACAVFHGEVIVSKDSTPTVAVLTTVGAAAAAAPLLRRVRDHLAGRGSSYKTLFPAKFWGFVSLDAAPAPLCLVGLSAAKPRGPPRFSLFQA
jgi:hypothetical protein